MRKRSAQINDVWNAVDDDDAYFCCYNFGTTCFQSSEAATCSSGYTKRIKGKLWSDLWDYVDNGSSFSPAKQALFYDTGDAAGINH
jgi:hypothetical protein